MANRTANQRAFLRFMPVPQANRRCSVSPSVVSSGAPGNHTFVLCCDIQPAGHLKTLASGQLASPAAEFRRQLALMRKQGEELAPRRNPAVLIFESGHDRLAQKPVAAAGGEFRAFPG